MNMVWSTMATTQRCKENTYPGDVPWLGGVRLEESPGRREMVPEGANGKHSLCSTGKEVQCPPCPHAAKKRKRSGQDPKFPIPTTCCF